MQDIVLWICHVVKNFLFYRLLMVFICQHQNCTTGLLDYHWKLLERDNHTVANLSPRAVFSCLLCFAVQWFTQVQCFQKSKEILQQKSCCLSHLEIGYLAKLLSSFLFHRLFIQVSWFNLREFRRQSERKHYRYEYHLAKHEHMALQLRGMHLTVEIMALMSCFQGWSESRSQKGTEQPTVLAL